MENLYKIKKALMNGLEELDTVKGGKIKMGELEAIKLITSSLDHIDHICEYEEDEGSSMAGDYSGRRGRSRATGRFVSHRSSYADGYSQSREEMMRHLEKAYAAAPDEETKRRTGEFMDRIDRA